VRLPCCVSVVKSRGGLNSYGSLQHEHRITIDPELMNGQPCIRGMRLTVYRVVEVVARYPDRTKLAQEYPEPEADDIRQSLEFAAGNLDDQIIALRTV